MLQHGKTEVIFKKKKGINQNPIKRRGSKNYIAMILQRQRN